MLKLTLTGIAVALGVSLGPAMAQPAPPAPAQQEATIVGLPLYSADGEKLGEVLHVGTHDGQPAVIAEMGVFLGMGVKQVLIPAEMVTRKGDRAKLPMTAEEVRKIISSQ
jgi:hypothetical protein